MYYPIGLGISAPESFEPWAHRIVNAYKREHPEVIVGHCGLDDDIRTANVILNLRVPINGKMVAIKLMYTITKSKSIEPHTLSEPIYNPPVACDGNVWSANGTDIESYVVTDKLPNPPSVMSVSFDDSTLYRPRKKREVAAIRDDDD